MDACSPSMDFETSRKSSTHERTKTEHLSRPDIKQRWPKSILLSPRVLLDIIKTLCAISRDLELKNGNDE